MEEKKKLHLDAPLLSIKQENLVVSKMKTTTRSKAIDSCQETEHETLVRLLQNLSFDHVVGPFIWEQRPGKSKDLHHKANTLIQELDQMNENKASCVVEEYKKKKIRSMALERVSMAINQDLQSGGDDDYEDHNNHVYSKKALFGLCSKNSVDVLIPVLSRIKTCQNIGVNPKSLTSASKTKPSSSRFLRSNRAMSKSQEPYPKPRFSTEISNISQPKHSPSPTNPRFLAEEVKRRREMKKIRSGNGYVSQLPMPKTPSESWLCRTLPSSSAASIVSSQATGFKKTNPQSTKWETIVKTSYKHHDHVRYTKELPSRQSKF